MITTTRRERLLIRWYYLLPSLGMHGLFYIILIAAEWVFLSMLDDLVFHDPGTPGCTSSDSSPQSPS